MSDNQYVGLENDYYGGMTPTGTIIRDAQVFGIIPETESCAGWDKRRLEALYDKVSSAWEPFGHLVSLLPEDLRQRHDRIVGGAIERAREQGWSPQLDDD